MTAVIDAFTVQLTAKSTKELVHLLKYKIEKRSLNTYEISIETLKH